MIHKHKIENQIWVDISSPNKEELSSLVKENFFDTIVAKDLLSPTPKQHSKTFGDTLYTVIHIPFFQHSKSVNSEQEIDFVINKESVLTVRYDNIDALHHFSKHIEAMHLLNKNGNNSQHIFFLLFKEIYSFLFDEIEYLKDWIKETEKNIFNNKEKEMVFSISATSRNILSFKRIIYPHRRVFENMMEDLPSSFGNEFKKELKMLLEEWERLMIEINNVSDMLHEIRETNNSILSTKQNEVMKTFTILAFVILPVSLIASIFGMNTYDIPVIGLRNDFWIVLGLMVFVSLSMFLYFKYKRWI